MGVRYSGGRQVARVLLSQQGMPPPWLGLFQTQEQQLEQQQQAQLQYQAQHHQWQVQQQQQALGSPPFYGGAHTPPAAQP